MHGKKKGNCLKKLGYYKDAIHAYKKSVDFDESDEKVFLISEVAELYLLSNNFIEAQNIIVRADIYVRNNREKILINFFKLIIGELLQEETATYRKEIVKLIKKGTRIRWSFVDLKKCLLNSNWPNKTRVVMIIKRIENNLI